MVSVKFTVPRIVGIGQFLAIATLALYVVLFGVVLFAEVTLLEKLVILGVISLIYGLAIGYFIVISNKFAYYLRVENGRIILRNYSKKITLELAKIRIFKDVGSAGKAVLLFIPAKSGILRQETRGGLGKVVTQLFAIKGILSGNELSLVEEELGKQRVLIEQW